MLIAKAKVSLTKLVGGLPHASSAADGVDPLPLPMPEPAPPAAAVAAAAAVVVPPAAASTLSPRGALASESHMLLRTCRAALQRRHA